VLILLLDLCIFIGLLGKRWVNGDALSD
jgi:hypothetical protein